MGFRSGEGTTRAVMRLRPSRCQWTGSRMRCSVNQKKDQCRIAVIVAAD